MRENGVGSQFKWAHVVNKPHKYKLEDDHLKDPASVLEFKRMEH